ncbi:biotin--[acetyl-CoA-carboxylase] ligase [Niameybacter massiliensis]|uniref:biotin--[biotin carboxyl-carrier protein] ligase n=1 Tax=Holtiella tumoricola TaxID=3018743 RepID=A0AA42DSK7_9FIRM|nr:MULTISPECIES: biotin--[acetyl-CoA-carboxylase] ligase [Lachnospirales]MDA3734246.1 biotin--[acetyl-CoA-carboxylase] ligase [Holtiella tumoricola]
MELNWIKQSNTLCLGKEIAYYEEIDSTNTRLKAWAKEGAMEGSIVIAEEQLQGKGRLGRIWDSPKETGIWMSILVKPQIGIEKIPQITLLAGLATCEAIRKTTGLEAMIKWPNDIVVNNKKVCGILCELVNTGKDTAVIIGIGINVNSKKFPDDLPYATSLYLEGKEVYMREPIISCLLEQLEGYYIQYKKQLSLHNIIEQYKDKCINMNREVNIVSSTESYRATVKDIDVEGRLIVQKQNGIEETILAGEVSVRGLYGYI